MTRPTARSSSPPAGARTCRAPILVSTPNNFNAALGRIGQIIDPKEDLVLVFVTSHGGPDGAVAIQEKGRMGGALRAVHLRDALMQAGINNKLVIVSACFSATSSCRSRTPTPSSSRPPPPTRHRSAASPAATGRSSATPCSTTPCAAVEPLLDRL